MAIKGTGKRGPPRGAPHLKLISGTDRADRAATGPVRLCDGSDPIPPDHLTQDELAEWVALIELLRPMGLLSGSDVGILMAYVITKCVIKDASMMINFDGGKSRLLTKTAAGVPTASPLVGIRSRAMDALVSYGVQLGLTPTARLRLNVELSQKKTNKFDFLKNDA